MSITQGASAKAICINANAFSRRAGKQSGAAKDFTSGSLTYIFLNLSTI
jgi:hypothetical protein